MKIEELDEVDDEKVEGSPGKLIASADAKRALIGAGARILFYPTLLYNVFRNKIQADSGGGMRSIRYCLVIWSLVSAENMLTMTYVFTVKSYVDCLMHFTFFDNGQIPCEFLMLGAVPFPTDEPRLKQLGVGGVVTLNEPYETLVPTSLYYAHGIDHLVIPTRDYLFAPSFAGISRAVDFIHKNSTSGRTTYVHCKAGRGRSTTIVLCYLIKYKHMTPVGALEFVRLRRPRVLLAPSQWQAVQEYSNQHLVSNSCPPPGDEVLITKADLEGYRCTLKAAIRKELTIVPKPTRSRPMIAKLSCLFSSLIVSGGVSTIARRLPGPEARAC